MIRGLQILLPLLPKLVIEYRLNGELRSKVALRGKVEALGILARRLPTVRSRLPI
jgi:hypothetical protein